MWLFSYLSQTHAEKNTQISLITILQIASLTEGYFEMFKNNFLWLKSILLHGNISYIFIQFSIVRYLGQFLICL